MKRQNTQIAIEAPILTWDEVSEIHRARHGIYQSDGRLVSLLTDFGRINPCYPDVHGEAVDTIEYTGSGRRGDQKLDVRNRALLAAFESQVTVPLFSKLGVNRWQYMGDWSVSDPKYIFDETQQRMLWRFTLVKDKARGVRKPRGSRQQAGGC